MREDMKLMWLGYLVYSLSNCATKLCIETGLTVGSLTTFKTPHLCFFRYCLVPKKF